MRSRTPAVHLADVGRRVFDVPPGSPSGPVEGPGARAPRSCGRPAACPTGTARRSP